jgi:hypothetical protein
MAVVESKLKTGKLLLGTTPGVEYGCQQTNVRIVPTHNEDGDSVETLCGDVLAPSTTTTWTLNGTAIQDWDAPGGISFTQYSWEHNGEIVDFSWQPNASTTKFTGKVTVRALELGGDVNTRITSDFEWPLSGEPTVVGPLLLH